jgi:hypothetical protein
VRKASERQRATSLKCTCAHAAVKKVKTRVHSIFSAPLESKMCSLIFQHYAPQYVHFRLGATFECFQPTGKMDKCIRKTR